MATLITLSNCCEYSSRTVDGLRQCSNRFPSSYIWAQCDPSIIQFPKKCQKTILWCFDQFTYMFQESLQWNIISQFTLRTYLSFRIIKKWLCEAGFFGQTPPLDSLTFFPYCLSKSSFCLRKNLLSWPCQEMDDFFGQQQSSWRKLTLGNNREQSVYFISC